MTIVTAASAVPVWKDEIIGDNRVIAVYVGSEQVAGAVEHRRYGTGETFWHVISVLKHIAVDGGIYRTPLEARDERTARQWLEFLSALYAGFPSALRRAVQGQC